MNGAVITGSDGHFVILGSDHLTTLPAAKVIERPARVADRPARGVERATGRARRSSTYGTDDSYCHIFVGSAPYRYTSCGLRLNPLVPIEQTHRKPPCPNGNPPCPECVRTRAEADEAAL
jgi:hypothetical protein